jgi:hypothetical protein
MWESTIPNLPFQLPTESWVPHISILRCGKVQSRKRPWVPLVPRIWGPGKPQVPRNPRAPSKTRTLRFGWDNKSPHHPRPQLDPEMWESANRIRPCQTHGPKTYPLPNKSVRVRSCGSSFSSEPLAAPDLVPPSPAAGRLFRWSPSIHFQGIPQTGPGEHTETPGATPRKNFRILKNRPQVNEFPAVDPCGSKPNPRLHTENAMGPPRSVRARVYSCRKPRKNEPGLQRLKAAVAPEGRPIIAQDKPASVGAVLGKPPPIQRAP